MLAYFKNYEEEKKRVIVHGISSPLGYKDKTEEETKTMRETDLDITISKRIKI